MSEEIGPEAYWRSALAEGRFLLQKSASEGVYVFPPRSMTPSTGTDDLEWVRASGKGSVYSVTTINPRPPLEPYNVALVDLDEGPRVMTRIEGIAAEDIKIGTRVRARIGVENGAPILLFDAVSGPDL
jgi:uncharacterized protein